MHSSPDQTHRQEEMISLTGFSVFISCFLHLTVGSGDRLKIIRGKEVPKHSLPFMALVGQTEPICGGTLIDRQWVLTAAHCMPVTTVWLGVHSIKSVARENEYRQNRKVIRSFPHPGYNQKTSNNDLMLLKLDRPAAQTKWVSPLKLNSNIKDPKGGTRCRVAGWGKTEFGKYSDVLRAVTVTVVGRPKCNSRGYYNSGITKSMMCAGSNGKKVADTCEGDSGGPIVCNRVLTGVTSFGDGCGKIRKPGVYAFLNRNLLNWTRNTMRR